eukprot:scaffold38_cov244-Alexandrium_tamarense.AAC.5
MSDFLRVHGHAKGGLICTDKGEELARSVSFCQAMLQRHNFDVTTTSSDANLAPSNGVYIVEPTGADTPTQNSRAEKWNDTLATTPRVLLYSSGLPPKYWLVALRHTHGMVSNLVCNIKVFGSRVCVAKPGKRYAKLDRGDYRGIFLGYTATDANVIYLGLDTGVVKSSPSATFDEAWYTLPLVSALRY